MRDGSGKWLPSQWQQLMKLTLRAIDSVSAEAESPAWTFGGGTALAIDLQHRISYDIDVSLDSAVVTKALVPVQNSVTRDICWNPVTLRPDYQWPGSYLKLIVFQLGEIDFLNVAPLVEQPVVPFEFDGRIVQRERPAEVIAKKIYYRGAGFKSRDVFDLAGAFIKMPEELKIAARSPFLSEDIIKRVRFRIEARKAALDEELAEETNPTEFGRSYQADASRVALDALAFIDAERNVANA